MIRAQPLRIRCSPRSSRSCGERCSGPWSRHDRTGGTGGRMGRMIKGEGRVVTADALAARDEAAEIRAEARRQGHAEGYAAGRDAAAAETLQLLAAAHAHADEVRTRARDAAVVLARKMAEKIVGCAIDLDPALMQEIAAQALASSRARMGPVAVRVHPDDHAPLQRHPPAWAPRAAALDVKLVP